MRREGKTAGISTTKVLEVIAEEAKKIPFNFSIQLHGPYRGLEYPIYIEKEGEEIKYVVDEVDGKTECSLPVVAAMIEETYRPPVTAEWFRADAYLSFARGVTDIKRDLELKRLADLQIATVLKANRKCDAMTETLRKKY